MPLAMKKAAINAAIFVEPVAMKRASGKKIPLTI
jgi:hypothetical protein